ncbi:hypothetical protein IFT98_12870 [Pseudomonas sp. CFBP 8770]|jgi:hypothetical protein|uniref:hypothetical protein n=1 Tax=unclassified Pseudomonas TaxID=196821 RepID=UPI000F023AC7|nr:MULTISPECIES: hypothetical protein [unclassified Pseudomonas]MBD8474752.1 hypothetical protein [Pseudomonas sp. CFBP 8773]MBD8647881.1 hypothetical protein [Pseudomonas sp. CFBP 8770]
MKTLSALLILGVLSGCASYSDRGTGEGGREIGSKGYTVRCDATPANQPGCYSPPPSYSWNFMKNFHLKLGQN